MNGRGESRHCNEQVVTVSYPIKLNDDIGRRQTMCCIAKST